MTKTAIEATIGFIVLAVAAVFLYVLAGNQNSIGGGTYEVEASFRSVSGVNVGSDVRIGGVKVGTVTNLELDKETYMAVIRFSLPNDLEVPEDSYVQISSEGLLGGSFVSLDPGASDEVVQPGGEIENTQDSVDFLTLLMKMVGVN
ncbi:MAG: outer membrane lipid asymmetry maintenance protein MlaD [Albidovulum sp.]|nr:outer membrane lipid asymmetry maintenance protein MlaD [Albidovulum sp.]MDE0304159.1 outer membrane lipid asymmetry maintenance protein MlaD [Albidovulum sp.]MDE0533472.1 outer membrane lipid asymmetry maintenance protein MlaD [Albidovulum sp.]